MGDSRADIQASAALRRGIPGVRYTAKKAGQDDLCEIFEPKCIVYDWFKITLEM